MNVYDFDKTIYDGDSTADFIMMCLKKRPYLSFRFMRCGITFAGFKAGKVSKTDFKEVMYRFLRDIKDIDDLVEEFWDKNISKIKKFYINNQKEDDVIISASPEFLLKDICARLGIRYLIASKIDRYTGCCLGVNCYGAEKVRRFYKEILNTALPEDLSYDFKNKKTLPIDEFYSDSLSDSPLAKIAKTAYLVDGEKLKAWPET